MQPPEHITVSERTTCTTLIIIAIKDCLQFSVAVAEIENLDKVFRRRKVVQNDPNIHQEINSVFFFYIFFKTD